MLYGLEKESLVFDQDFNPYQFLDTIFDDNTALDFCDHQLELITNPVNSITKLYEDIVHLALNKYPHDSYIWPVSANPCLLKFSLDNKNIDDLAYHYHLKNTYTPEMLLTSGIHFNVSGFDSDLITMCQKIYTYAPLILVFFSFSPIKNTKIISSRNTNLYGYYNEQNFMIDFSSLEKYNQSLETLITNHQLDEKRELYSRIRIKNNEYLELRFIDLNPYYISGINYEQLVLLETFIKYLDNVKLDNFDHQKCVSNFDLVAMQGQDLELLLEINGKNDTLKNHIIRLLDNLTPYNPVIIKEIKNNFLNNQCDFQLFLQTMEYYPNICDFAKKNCFHFANFTPLLPDLNLELSTKIMIDTAQKQNLNVKIISEADNVILINDRLVIKATQTNIDTYANILILENKAMTKYFLDLNHIKTPQGIVINNDDIDYQAWLSKPIVIKPLDTNYGEGISILKENNDIVLMKHAINYALEFSNEIIIETFIPGKEFRFLVIDEQCVSIIHRDACNIIGDGKQTINELIIQANTNPLRGNYYQKPLQQIKIDEEMLLILEKQGYDLNTILPLGKKVYLRNNSNISTGGQSYEVFDYIPKYFKQIAIKAAKSLGVKICGIDMIIPDIYKQDYAIIEANFNPAIHMHTYPYYGLSRNPSPQIINLLLTTTND